MKVLVCGSRDYELRGEVFAALDEVYGEALPKLRKGAPFTVIHGAHPTGADLFAHEWCAQNSQGTAECPCPANWHIGTKAGPIRNQAMVDAKPDLVLAFDARNRPNGRESGTMDTIKRAIKAGIPIRIYP